MSYFPGQIITNFLTKKNKEIVIKTPEISNNVDDLHFFNNLVKENDYILSDTPYTLEQITKKIQSKIISMENNTGITLYAFCENKLVANINLDVYRGHSRHVASMGVFVDKNYREERIGTKLMKTAFREARKIGIKLVELRVFATNLRAIGAYKKMGFKNVGILPKAAKVKNKYIDNIIMYKELNSSKPKYVKPKY